MSILRADSIRDRAGTGAPDFPNGLTGNVTGNVTGSSGSASGLTGTPNITVGTVGCGNVTSTGDVTGVNATFSGNLTVQGTTTTIDTAVTSVDSLAVDGLTTSGGFQATGNTTPSTGSGVEIFKPSATEGRIQTYDRGSTAWMDLRLKGQSVTLSTSNTDAVGINSTGTAIFKAGLAEKFNNTGTTMSSGTHAIQSGNIIRFTGNESGANALNITGIHSTLANGEALSFTVICTPNNSGYISGFNIDGVAPATAIKWSGGSAPSASASGQDVYTFTVLKIGTATNAYEVYGAMTNYA